GRRGGCWCSGPANRVAGLVARLVLFWRSFSGLGTIRSEVLRSGAVAGLLVERLNGRRCRSGAAKSRGGWARRLRRHRHGHSTFGSREDDVERPALSLVAPGRCFDNQSHLRGRMMHLLDTIVDDGRLIVV